MRKPLYPIEREAPPATVCVTGGTGYIAGAIIARLLAAGHTVHATVRDPANEQKLRWLKALPQAGTHLKFFKVISGLPGGLVLPVLHAKCISPSLMRYLLEWNCIAAYYHNLQWTNYLADITAVSELNGRYLAHRPILRMLPHLLRPSRAASMSCTPLRQS